MFSIKSRRISLIINLIAIFLSAFILLRLIFAAFWLDLDNLMFSEIASAFYLGLKFDLRLAIILIIPIISLTALPKYNLATSNNIARLARWYISAVSFVVLFCYWIDFGYYDYLNQRVDISVVRFIEDAAISASMAWQSYPVIIIVIAWFLASLILRYIALAILNTCLNAPKIQLTSLRKTCYVSVLALGLLGGLYGKASTIQLRWSEAFSSNNPALIALGLNPILYFFDTSRVSHQDYDLSIVKQHYPLVARYLGVKNPDVHSLNFTRHIPAKDTKAGGMNVIFVMLESMGANRLGVYGNSLNPTPNLDEIAKQGLLFTNFFVPVSGTARTVFASITGIPDVSKRSTASRNPLIIKQHSILNAFTEYSKHYFIGGNLSWANVRGLLTHNIKGLTTYEQPQYNSEMVDVWGISDLALFNEATDILLEQQQPIFAYIQTAGNHRPFTIPEDNQGFIIKEHAEETVHNAGFLSNAQYNAVRLADHSIGKFMDNLRSSKLANNTIVVFFGDHNDASKPSKHMGLDDTLNLTSLHVPLIIYAPSILKPRVIEQPASLVDLLPTIASILGLAYTNTTMGRDIFNLSSGQTHAALTVTGGGTYPKIGLYGTDFFFNMLLDSSSPSLHDLKATSVENLTQQNIYQRTTQQKHALTQGLYHSSHYMFSHNQP
jgi:phosphoglycerol transferase MdoB-like AlkP superfamily enzyme